MCTNLKWFRTSLGLAAAAVLSHSALAVPITVSTAPFAGVSGRLEFVLLDNDFLSGNSVTISNIASNGVFVGTDCSIGCTAGPSSFVLDDSLGFGQLLYDLTLGTVVTFELSFTTNYSASPGIDPDQLRVNLLDPATNFTLVRTDLLPPSDAVLAVDLVGNGIVQSPTVVTPVSEVNQVPEPGSIALAAIALLALARRRVVAAVRAVAVR